MTIHEALDSLLALGGSDLIISAGTRPQIRRDGILEPLAGALRLAPAQTERMVCGILDPDKREQLAARRQVDFAFTWRDRVRIRGNVFYQRGSVSACFRLLPLQIPTFDELGVPASVRRLLARERGLILVTGPTGSGKSTTQAAMVDYLNRTRACHIITIEDPIEYVHRHCCAVVQQRQVGVDVPSFSDALRAVFRENPDVVLIGEMRDLETMSAALTLAETGHQVLATLHTNDSVQALDRIVDGFPTVQQHQVRAQLAASLTGVIYQQLLPAVGGGRLAAFEVLVATAEIRTLIRDGDTAPIRGLMRAGARHGSRTLEDSLTELLAHGLVTDRDARARSLHPQEIVA